MLDFGKWLLISAPHTSEKSSPRVTLRLDVIILLRK